MAGNNNQSGTNLFASTTSTLSACLADSDGYIYFGSCTGAPPTTASTFQHGCQLVQTDSGTSNMGVWQNVGSIASPSWVLVAGNGTAVTSASPSVTFTTNVTVTSAQLLAIGTTPVTLVAAQGSGKVIVIENAVYTLVGGGTAYAGGSALKTAYGTDGSGVTVLSNVTSAFVNTASGVTASQVLSATPASYVGAGNSVVVLAGVGVSPTAGTGVLNASIRWRIATQS